MACLIALLCAFAWVTSEYCNWCVYIALEERDQEGSSPVLE